MKLNEIAQALELKVTVGEDKLDQAVTGGYVGDLLSDVMGHAREGQVWITRQAHQNIVAVADLKDLAGIILVNGCEPADDTGGKAREKGIPILVSSLPAFELTGKVYLLMVTGKSDVAVQ